MKERLAGVGREGGGGGLFLGIRGGGMSSVSPNPDPISHKNIGIFHTCLRPGIRRNEVIIFRLKLISSIKKTS